MNDFLGDLSDIVARRLAERGVSTCISRAVVQLVVQDIREVYGGDRPYISKGVYDHARSLHARIRAEFTGDNIEQLALRYKRSRTTIYQIVRSARAGRKGLNVGKEYPSDSLQNGPITTVLNASAKGRDKAT